MVETVRVLVAIGLEFAAGWLHEVAIVLHALAKLVCPEEAWRAAGK
jgi:hypothetical protein